MPQSSFGEALTRLWPHGDEKIPGLRAGMIETAPATFQKYGIDTPLLVAHVMAQISHECGAGHDVVENLSYSADRLIQVWPRHFNSGNAPSFAHNPQKLANFIYNPPEHNDLGNREGSDDGWMYRGRGASQTTGRAGYQKLAERTGLDLLNQPDLVNDPKHFMDCGVADFVICGCLPYAKRDDVVAVSSMLNVGHIVDDPRKIVGLTERKMWLARWKAAIGSMPVGNPSTNTPAPPLPGAPPITAGDTKPAPADLHEKDNEPNLGPQPPAPSFATAFVKLLAFILSLFTKRK